MSLNDSLLLTFLVNAIWQIPLFTLLALLASRIMRSGPAAHRHAIWVAALFAAVLLPLIGALQTRDQPDPMRIDITYAPETFTGSAEAGSSAPASIASQRHSVDFAENFSSGVTAIYVLFLLFGCTRVIQGWSRTRWLLRSATPVLSPSQVLQRTWTRCEQVFGIRGVALLASDHLSSPATVGGWHKAILLPKSLLDETSEDVLVSAIGHEMAHIARRDFAANLLYEFLFLPISVHPGAWPMMRGIRESRELACDEAVTRRLLEPDVYARSILQIAAASVTPARADYSLGVFDANILEKRIRRLLDGRVAVTAPARLLLLSGISAMIVCAVVASGLAITARAQSGAYAELKLAETAYNAGDFAKAIQHFGNAAQLDPSDIKTKLFLANALTSEHFKIAPLPESPLLVQAAQQYEQVLAQDPSNSQAMHGLMSVSMLSKKLTETLDWAGKLVASDRNDKAALYTFGVASWALVFPEYQREKARAGGRLDEAFIHNANVRKTLRDHHMPRLESGIGALQQALAIDAGMDDAMAYLNLLFRIKAGIADSQAESAQLIAEADAWIGKALAVKRTRSGSAPVQSRIDVDGPAPGPATGGVARFRVAPPPPPPPPPPPGWQQRNQIASPEAPPRARGAVEQPFPYWHVIGPADMRAVALLNELHAKGFRGNIHLSPVDRQVRVMAGPFQNEAELSQAKLDLEKAGFKPLRIW